MFLRMRLLVTETKSNHRKVMCHETVCPLFCRNFYILACSKHSEKVDFLGDFFDPYKSTTVLATNFSGTERQV